MALHQEANQSNPRAHLFMLRLWPEDVGSDRVDWRGKIQHVNTGEVSYFRGWQALKDFLDAMLCEDRGNQSEGDTTNSP